MFGVGTQELLVILFVILILFGSKRIPDAARSLGSGLASFRRAVRDAQRELDTELLREPRARGEQKPALPPACQPEKSSSGESAPQSGQQQPTHPDDGNRDGQGI